MQDIHQKRRFVEPTIIEEASLTDVTLTSGGRGPHGHTSKHSNGHRGNGPHGAGHQGGGGKHYH